MTQVLRSHLLSDVSLQSVSHLGLALSRYLPAGGDKGQAKSELLDAVAGKGQASGYDSYYQRFVRAAQATGKPTRVLTLSSQGRSLVGLGLESVLENSLATHHTYGVPVLSGSALKGLVAAFARHNYEGWSPERAGGPYQRVFGYAPEKGRQKQETELGASGLVTFHDALPVPGQWRIHREVMTTHHSDYYMKDGAPPADWDEPIPVPFVSASGTFTLVLTAEAQSDVQSALDAVVQLLTVALAEEGIGAKTSSGYGRFLVESQAANTQVTQDKEGAAQSATQAQTATPQPSKTPSNLPDWVQKTLSTKWSFMELQQPNSKVHEAARRVLKEKDELGPERAQASAKAVLELFAKIDVKGRKKFNWYAELLALSES